MSTPPPNSAVTTGSSAEPARALTPIVLTSPLSEEQIIQRLDQAGRRGKLAGFARATKPGALFEVTDFGTPFESVLIASAVNSPEGTRLTLRAKLKPTAPIVFALSLVVTIWPGVWLTDSLLRTYFTGYHWTTWWWYMPLTAPFCPWAFWVAIKRSRLSAAEAVAEIIPRIARLIDAPTADGGI